MASSLLENTAGEAAIRLGYEQGMKKEQLEVVVAFSSGKDVRWRCHDAMKRHRTIFPREQIQVYFVSPDPCASSAHGLAMPDDLRGMTINLNWKKCMTSNHKESSCGLHDSNL